ncbi:hypothetical protein BJ165DRAFT_1531511 [Panaeolus papilionaceus]|nr:hypothetical protein BJ165DRAFT_1531511 [Panaeolus papilionaceus]
MFFPPSSDHILTDRVPFSAFSTTSSHGLGMGTGFSSCSGLAASNIGSINQSYARETAVSTTHASFADLAGDKIMEFRQYIAESLTHKELFANGNAAYTEVYEKLMRTQGANEEQRNRIIELEETIKTLTATTHSSLPPQSHSPHGPTSSTIPHIASSTTQFPSDPSQDPILSAKVPEQLPILECSNAKFYYRASWNDYKSHNTVANRPVPKSTNFITDLNSNTMSPKWFEQVWAVSSEALASLYFHQLAPTTASHLIGPPAMYYYSVMLLKFPEFRYCKNNWKLQAWITKRFPDWYKTLKKGKLLPQSSGVPVTKRACPGLETVTATHSTSSSTLTAPPVAVSNRHNLESDCESMYCSPKPAIHVSQVTMSVLPLSSSPSPLLLLSHPGPITSVVPATPHSPNMPTNTNTIPAFQSSQFAVPTPLNVESDSHESGKAGAVGVVNVINQNVVLIQDISNLCDAHQEVPKCTVRSQRLNPLKNIEITKITKNTTAEKVPQPNPDNSKSTTITTASTSSANTIATPDVTSNALQPPSSTVPEPEVSPSSAEVATRMMMMMMTTTRADKKQKASNTSKTPKMPIPSPTLLTAW